MAGEQAAATQGTTEAASAAAAAGASQTSTQAATQSQAERPAYIPEAYWDADKREVKADDLGKYFQAAGERDRTDAERAAAVPAKADDYKVEMPEGFKLPEGWQVDPKSPMWKLGAEFAKANGLTQKQYSDLAASYINGQVQQAASAVEVRNAEFAKLGATGAARVEAVHKFIDAAAGTPERAAAVKASLITADAVAFIERLQGQLASAGISSFGRGGEERPDPTKIEGYETMSFTERWNAGKPKQARA